MYIIFIFNIDPAQDCSKPCNLFQTNTYIVLLTFKNIEKSFFYLSIDFVTKKNWLLRQKILEITYSSIFLRQYCLHISDANSS